MIWFLVADGRAVPPLGQAGIGAIGTAGLILRAMLNLALTTIGMDSLCSLSCPSLRDRAEQSVFLIWQTRNCHVPAMHYKIGWVLICRVRSMLGAGRQSGDAQLGLEIADLSPRDLEVLWRRHVYSQGLYALPLGKILDLHHVNL